MNKEIIVISVDGGFQECYEGPTEYSFSSQKMADKARPYIIAEAVKTYVRSEKDREELLEEIQDMDLETACTYLIDTLANSYDVFIRENPCSLDILGDTHADDLEDSPDPSRILELSILDVSSGREFSGPGGIER